MQKVILGWLWYLGIIPDIRKYLLNVVTAVKVVFISILHFFPVFYIHKLHIICFLRFKNILF